jgi:4-diphosphocytidyl-2-C-methyl-D-erythritol kinase
MVVLRAPAKINLFLRVFWLRDDGYHEIFSSLVRLSLADEIILTPTLDPLDQLTYELSYDRPFGSLAAHVGEPLDKEFDDHFKASQPDPGFEADNLALKALRALRAKKSTLGYFRVFIRKNIPIAAGLGGGSSDAAAILSYFGPRLGLSDQALKDLALSLGSDIPFFLGPKFALATGRGEILSPCKGDLPKRVLLITPKTPLATGQVFRELALTKEADKNNLEPTRRPRLEFEVLGVNDLLAPARRLLPEIGAIEAALANLGAEIYGLSGSGPTFFALFRTKDEVNQAYESLKKQPWRLIQTTLDIEA